jgi:hypothetical protein
MHLSSNVSMNCKEVNDVAALCDHYTNFNDILPESDNW